MLEDCLFASRPSRSKKPATLVLSILAHGTLAGFLILIPLFQNQLLPQIPLFEPLRPPVARGPISLVPIPHQAARASSAPAPQQPALIAPQAIPTKIVILDEPSTAPVGFLPRIGGGGNGLPGGFSDGDSFGMPGERAPAPPPPPPAPPAAPPTPPLDSAPAAPVRIGGGVVQSNLIYTVKPTYPRLAVIARVQGAVVLEAVITREGTIDASRLRVLTGHPMLTPAAIEAVQQWRYRPTLLNGEPVEILTTVTVNFSLN